MDCEGAEKSVGRRTFPRGLKPIEIITIAAGLKSRPFKAKTSVFSLRSRLRDEAAKEGTLDLLWIARVLKSRLACERSLGG